LKLLKKSFDVTSDLLKRCHGSGQSLASALSQAVIEPMLCRSLLPMLGWPERVGHCSKLQVGDGLQRMNHFLITSVACENYGQGLDLIPVVDILLTIILVDLLEWLIDRQ
jgi:hypothetical protein